MQANSTDGGASSASGGGCTALQLANVVLGLQQPAQLVALLQLPGGGGWRVLSSTTEGQQLLQAWLSLQLTVCKGDRQRFEDHLNAGGVQMALMKALTSQLHSGAVQLIDVNTGSQSKKQRKNHEAKVVQQREQREQASGASDTAAPALPDPQLLASVLMLAARQCYGLGQRLQQPSAATELAAYFAGQQIPSNKSIALQAEAVPDSSQQELNTFLVQLSNYSFSTYWGVLSSLLDRLCWLATAASGAHASSCVLPDADAAHHHQQQQQQQQGQQQERWRLPHEWVAALHLLDSGSAGGAGASSLLSDMQAAHQKVHAAAARLERGMRASLAKRQELQDAALESASAAASSLAFIMELVNQALTRQEQAVLNSKIPGHAAKHKRSCKLKDRLHCQVMMSEPLQLLDELSGALHSMAQLLSAAVPSRCSCNNPACTNLATGSEAFALVRGAACVCSGCLGGQPAGGTDGASCPPLAARYCSVMCQQAHWPAHKLVCSSSKGRVQQQQE